MATLKLKVSDKVLDKVIWLLRQFNQEDVEIIESNSSFETNRNYVHEELRRLEARESKSYTIDEVDEILENSIRQYEG
jgi:hypothetical protein